MKKRKGFFRENADAFISIIIILSLAFSLNIYNKEIAAKIAVSATGILVANVNVISEINEQNLSSKDEKINVSNIRISENGEYQSVNLISNSYNVPSDIAELAKKYKKEYANAEHDGKILEKTFDEKGASSVFKNITVRNTTPSHSVNIEKSVNKRASLNITDISKPTVLIFHTHTTESYELIDEGWYTNSYPTRHDDKSQNMVRVGDAICEELEKNGIGVIHDTQIYDHKYTGAYDLSRKTVEKILKENPSIQIVLDVHRDAIKQSDGTKLKPTFTYDGKKAAQIMIITGCEDGKVKDFPNWEQNLTFALQLHQKIETMYPHMMRPILFSARKYNMDVVPCSVLLEFGSESNTLAEAEYSGHLVGNALSEYIKEYSEK